MASLHAQPTKLAAAVLMQRQLVMLQPLQRM